jgi:hypothetical protein
MSARCQTSVSICQWLTAKEGFKVVGVVLPCMSQVKGLAKRLAVIEQQLTDNVLDDFKLLMGTADVKVGGSSGLRSASVNDAELVAYVVCKSMPLSSLSMRVHCPAHHSMSHPLAGVPGQLGPPGSRVLGGGCSWAQGQTVTPPLPVSCFLHVSHCTKQRGP